MRRLIALVDFDEEAGMPSLAATCVQITLDNVGKLDLGPAMDMLCRSRLMMPGDVTIVSGGVDAYWEEHGTKRKGTHVHLVVQRDNVQEVCMWAARVGASHVVSGDASRARDGSCSRGSLRHDGVVKQGMIVEDDCDDNYLAELAAILDQAEEVPEGSRIVIMLDATSPVHAAFIKFRAAHARRRARYYGSTWLDTLDQLLEPLNAVVFLWQTSHVGSPMNEWRTYWQDRASRTRA